MNMTTIKHAPVLASAITPEWIADVRATALRDGHAIRAGYGNSIEVQSINTGNYGQLMLPGGGFIFASADDRDAILRQIQEGAKAAVELIDAPGN